MLFDQQKMDHIAEMTIFPKKLITKTDKSMTTYAKKTEKTIYPKTK